LCLDCFKSIQNTKEKMIQNHIPDDRLSSSSSDKPHVGSGGRINSNVKQHFTWRNPFLIAFLAIFIAGGVYAVSNSSADTVDNSKVWSTAADWSGGALNDTVVSGDSVGLASTITPGTITTTTAATTDLALNRPAYASSVSYGNNYNHTAQVLLSAKYVDDGNLTTRWSSKYSNNQWIYVDLGSVKDINEIKLTWENAYAKDYAVQVSTGTKHWHTVYITSKGAGGVTDLTGLKTSGRFVRMRGLQRATQWGYSLWEMGVYGDSVTTTTPTTTTTYDKQGSVTQTFDAGSSAIWTSLAAKTTLPTGAGASYEARTSANDSTWSNWATIPSSGSLASLASSRYIQVEANLSTDNISSTPLLNQLSLDYGISIASPTVSLTTSGSTLTTGGSAKLTWSSTNAAACTASGAWSGTQATSGSVTVSPTATSTYNLSCSGSGGTLAATPVTITVNPPATNTTTSSTSGCTYSGTVAPCVGNATTGASGWGTPVFDDEFNATSINTNVWNEENGYFKNGVTVSTSNEAETGGNLVLTLASSTSGAEISTNSFALPVGGYAEARIYFPGNGTNIYNWPAWWTSGPNWPAAGENDIAEGLGTLTVNYHSPEGANNGPTVPGNWSNAYHTYGIYRQAGKVTVYWDGVAVRSYSTDDNGQPQTLIFTNGCSGQCTAGSKVLVDYVRAWE
jgi:hypothetical protein